MRDAMADAELGDDVARLDPTVNRLEALAAAKVGKEAALFVPSGTMGSLLCLTVFGCPGDEALVDEHSHIYLNEGGGLSAVVGLTPRLLRSRDGLHEPRDIHEAVRPRNIHHPRPSILCLENTHNHGGGRIVPPDLFADLCAAGHEHDLRIVLDGARIFNAAIGAGVDVKTFTRHVDAITFCLSKGLGAPVGSVVAGDADFIEEARRARKRFGGGMRQAGVIAAAGIVALEQMVDRLAEDHANAKKLAELIERIEGLSVIRKPVETNMVFVDFTDLGVDGRDFQRQLELQGLMVGVELSGDHVFRAVTHRHVQAEHVDQAAAILGQVVAG